MRETEREKPLSNAVKSLISEAPPPPPQKNIRKFLFRPCCDVLDGHTQI